ncbi:MULTISPECIES: hypothetical protein [unclassified Microcoleus]|jgi:hypothetical protein|uniref:hypothetical protein n=1 Tax=unclassified Microcoleus TaxID=2642155 RepID=UPI0025EF81CB|nr:MULTISPECIES: hypothetical protein [unclassified Microcoleus]
MKAYEFPAKVTSEGKINLTDDILKYLAVNQDVRVIILVNEQTNSETDEVEEKTDWHRLAATQFFADCSEEDTIYDRV